MLPLLFILATQASANWNIAHRHKASTLDTNLVAEGTARNLSFHIMAIAIPDTFDSANEFVQGLGAVQDKDEAEAIPGVKRDLLDIEELQKEGKICSNYKFSGYKAKSHEIKSEVATTYAHLKAIDRFMEGDRDYAIIFEDDVEFSWKQEDIDSIAQDKGATLLEAMEKLIHKSPDFDEINLGRCRTVCEGQEIIASVSNEIKLAKAFQQLCSHAYLLSRSGAKKMHQALSKDLCSSNDNIKKIMAKRELYMQLSVTPRAFQQSGRCGVNGCGSDYLRECE